MKIFLLKLLYKSKSVNTKIVMKYMEYIVVNVLINVKRGNLVDIFLKYVVEISILFPLLKLNCLGNEC